MASSSWLSSILLPSPMASSSSPLYLPTLPNRRRIHGVNGTTTAAAATARQLQLQILDFDFQETRRRRRIASQRGAIISPFTCFLYNTSNSSSNDDKEQEEVEEECPVLERWDVPWGWSTIVLTMMACGVSVAVTGLAGAFALHYLGLEGRELSLDEKAELLLAGQLSITAVVLGVIYGITGTFQPLPDDIFRYDWKDPFNWRDGWLLWAAIGLFGALATTVLADVALSIFNGQNPQSEVDVLTRLSPFIASSSLSTACLVGVTGVLAPILEETVFRGFLMVSLTKWVPTPISVLITAALFAVGHLNPEDLPQLFLSGAALGFSYAQTRNLLTPITIHALWNTGVTLLTYLQIHGYDI